MPRPVVPIFSFARSSEARSRGPVVRHQQMSALAHADPAVEIDAPLRQGVVFLEEVE